MNRGKMMCALLGGTVLALGLGQPQPAVAQATTVHTEVQLSFVDTTFIPCALNGAGENVHSEGSIQLVANVTIDAQGKAHATFLFHPQGLTGTGLTSGATYHYTGETRFNYDPSGPLPASNTQVNNFRVIGPGPNNNI